MLLNKNTLSNAVKLAIAAQAGMALVVAGSELQPVLTPMQAEAYSAGLLSQPKALQGRSGDGGSASATVDRNGGNDDLQLQAASSRVRTVGVSNQPRQTLRAEDLRRLNIVNLESALNTLPQFVSGFDRSSNDLGDTRATANLRGLGNERTVLLINSRPFAPSDSLGASDLNAIPLGLLQQVNVQTGGASVAYGSGAVAGAVNFTLNENFQGAELNVSHQSTSSQDGDISNVDLTLGSGFAQNRGNIAVNFGASERKSILRGERDFSRVYFDDEVDDNGNPVLIESGSTGIPGTSIFSGGLSTFSPLSFGATFDPNGNIRPFQTGEPGDLYNYAPVNYLQLPQTRRHATAIAHFEFSEKLELYGLTMLSEVEAAQQFAPTPVFQSNAEFTLDGSPFLTPFSQQVLSGAVGNGIDSDGDGIDDTGSAFLRRRLVESGLRRAVFDTDSVYVQVGLRGELGAALSYDVFASRGSTDTLQTQEGNISRSRFQQSLLLDLQTDPGGGVCQQQTSDSIDIACVPANIFGADNISAAAVEFLAAGVDVETEASQTIYGASVTREFDFFSSVNASATLGVERRENSLKRRRIRTNLASFDDQSGFLFSDRRFDVGPALNLDVAGKTRSNSVFGGLYLPLLTDASGSALLDVELGYRLTDYTTTKNVSSFGANGSWKPFEYLRLHAGYNRAHRAPGIGELYLAQGFGSQSGAEPCLLAHGNAEIEALCIATGVPPEFYDGPPPILAGPRVAFTVGGNPDLEEEQADTFSVGVEVAVPFGDDSLIHMGVDYFNVDGSQGISPFGGSAFNVLQECYDPNNSSPDSLSVFCDVVNRRSDGWLESVDITLQNVAMFDVEGIDLGANFSTLAWGGSLEIDFNGTVSNNHVRTAYDGADPLQCAGKFGELCGEPVPSYSHRLSASWGRENLAASLIWRHTGEVEDDDDERVYFGEKLGTRNYLDAQASYAFGDSFVVGVGVQNLTNTAPPVLGFNQDQANTYPATYDVNGRSYFVRLTGSFPGKTD